MKKFFLFTFVFSLISACSADLNSDKEETPETDEPQYSFSYSIIIKDSINRDLLDPNIIGYYYRGNNGLSDGFLDMLFLSKENNIERDYNIIKYPNEWRIAVNFDFKKDSIICPVEMILTLIVIRPGYCHDGILTQDTISCDLSQSTKGVVCNSIKVNGQPAWMKNDLNEEPFIVLVKQPSDYDMVCSEDIY